MGKVKVALPRLTCQRCGKIWVPMKEDVRMCPRCKTTHWDEPRENKQGLRPQAA